MDLYFSKIHKACAQLKEQIHPQTQEPPQLTQTIKDVMPFLLKEYSLCKVARIIAKEVRITKSRSIIIRIYFQCNLRWWVEEQLW